MSLMTPKLEQAEQILSEMPRETSQLLQWDSRGVYLALQAPY